MAAQKAYYRAIGGDSRSGRRSGYNCAFVAHPFGNAFVRLTQLKLAGFKSFVDPTSIPVPDQRVGVVGPNGCGKSNIIDAVRWVLGESSAKQLRGDTMQDVIFDGSGTRKAVSRASVELHFDNSLGQAAGQWSTYAEIVVKRVLQRNGESSYYINNLQVRRRDITDLFLGTGVGARAYAIIEQGMISRVIESKPEELRVFLEEAAGVSKYKERRKETEARLRDTQENLTRVDDILEELTQQLERLASQAEVAQHYTALNDELATTRNLLLLTKKREATRQFERARNEVMQVQNELEAQTSALRHAEKLIEDARAAHYARGDAVQAAQGEMYAINSEIARIEQQLGHMRETRERLLAQQANLNQTLASAETRQQANITERADWQQQADEAACHAQQAGAELGLASSRVEAGEAAWRESETQLLELEKQASTIEQQRRLAETHAAHARNQIEQFEARTARLIEEQQGLTAPPPEAAGSVGATLARLGEEIATLNSAISAAIANIDQLEQSAREIVRATREAESQAAASAAHCSALKSVEAQRIAGNQAKDWLQRMGLNNAARLAPQLEIEVGWEAAVEAALGERLDAVEADPARFGEWLNAPPQGLTLYASGAEAVIKGAAALPLLSEKVSAAGAAAHFVTDSLAEVFAAANVEEAWAMRDALPPGGLIATQAGHLVSRFGLRFYGAGATAGVLVRQREIRDLERRAASQRSEAEALHARHAEAEQKIADARAALVTLRERLNTAQHAHHDAKVELLGLEQRQRHFDQRSAAIATELDELDTATREQRAKLAAALAEIDAYQIQLTDLAGALDEARQQREARQQALVEQRAEHARWQTAAHEAQFAIKTLALKIESANAEDARLAAQQAELAQALERNRGEIDAIDTASVDASLSETLARRLAHEQSLSQLRDALAEAQQALEQSEKERLQIEQKLDPLRERLEKQRLKEQEMRLIAEQCEAQLAEAHADQDALQTLLEAHRGGSGTLESRIAELARRIEALGAVNLAALEELKASDERKQYLEAQAADLRAGVETLEQAIRRIDKETRGLLSETFEKVNRHFRDLFPTIFGGGHAELILTGEEILDAGVTLIAQPPGKRNSSIHLLSGGEKALTALALIFSLFQLNPAPFCLLDEVDAPLDDTNTERFCELVKRMSQGTQFIFITHNKISMSMAQQLVGVTMQESGVSRIVAVDVEEAARMREQAAVS